MWKFLGDCFAFVGMVACFLLLSFGISVLICCALWMISGQSLDQASIKQELLVSTVSICIALMFFARESVSRND